MFFLLNIPSACGIAYEEAERELQIELLEGQEEEEPDGNKENSLYFAGLNIVFI